MVQRGSSTAAGAAQTKRGTRQTTLASFLSPKKASSDGETSPAENPTASGAAASEPAAPSSKKAAKPKEAKAPKQEIDRPKRSSSLKRKAIVESSDSEESESSSDDDDAEIEAGKKKPAPRGRRAASTKAPSAKKRRRSKNDSDEEFVAEDSAAQSSDDEADAGALVDEDDNDDTTADTTPADSSDNESAASKRKKGKRKAPSRTTSSAPAAKRRKTPSGAAAAVASATAESDSDDNEDSADNSADSITERIAKKRESGQPLSLSEQIALFLEDKEEGKSLDIPRDQARHLEFIASLKKVREQAIKAEERSRKSFGDGDADEAAAAAASAMAEEEEAAEADEEEEQKPKKKAKGGRGGGKKSSAAASSAEEKLTPLEQQVVKLKKENPGILLMIEVGHRYIFYGDDAEQASKILGVITYRMKHSSFLQACVPSYRGHVYLRRLVASGHKVGLVRQTETAAIKAAESESKSGPFTRSVVGIYSRATMIPGQEIGDTGAVEDSHDACGYIMCIVEGSFRPNPKVVPSSQDDPVELEGESASQTLHEKEQIAVVAVNAATGTILYDFFEDGFLRRQLSTRLAEMEPSELILPKGRLSSNTEYTIETSVRSDSSGESVRIERLSDDMFEAGYAKNNLDLFYGFDRKKDSEKDRQYFETLLESVMELPAPVQVALSCTVEYLRQYKLADMMRIPGGVTIQDFSARSRMNISGITLNNLEILRNSSTGTTEATLFSVVNHCKTAFGIRLLKQWLCHPLLDLEAIRARLDAVEEIKKGETLCLQEIETCISKMPDIERSLLKVFYGRCTPAEFLRLLRCLQQFYSELPEDDVWKKEIKSKLLLQLLGDVPDLAETIDEFLASFNQDAAEKGKREDLFKDVESAGKTDGADDEEDEEEEDEFTQHTKAYNDIEAELSTYLKKIGKIVGKSGLELKEYKNERLIELSKPQAKRLEDYKPTEEDEEEADDDDEEAFSFVLVHQTKTVSRYTSPKLKDLLKRQQYHTEKLALVAKDRWAGLLRRFCAHFSEFKRLVEILATLDCLYSLAEVSKQPNYCKPEFCAAEEGTAMKLKDSRHPIIERQLRNGEPYVPNSISLSRDGITTLVMTGPNMGGKSSLCRQVALIAIMAQMGCFVPCSSALLPVFDNVFTRMGAHDDLAHAKSTFFVELNETSEIIRRATPSSLVILDELGRGTSTTDGKAIAYSTLEYIVKQLNCFTLFVTHFPVIGNLERVYPSKVRCYFMSYLTHDEESEGDEDDGSALPRVTFLYKLKRGVASSSYGLNVAALAGMDPSVLKVAEKKARDMEKQQTLETSIQLFVKLHQLLGKGDAALPELRQLQLDANEVLV